MSDRCDLHMTAVCVLGILFMGLKAGGLLEGLPFVAVCGGITMGLACVACAGVASADCDYDRHVSDTHSITIGI